MVVRAFYDIVVANSASTWTDFCVAKQDLSQYENGIGPLTFESLRVISYPGGQQYGAINPCEMNEFSDECEAWEAENGPFVKGDFMVKSNPRTKGRWAIGCDDDGCYTVGQESFQETIEWTLLYISLKITSRESCYTMNVASTNTAHSVAAGLLGVQYMPQQAP